MYWNPWWILLPPFSNACETARVELCLHISCWSNAVFSTNDVVDWQQCYVSLRCQKSWWNTCGTSWMPKYKLVGCAVSSGHRFTMSLMHGFDVFILFCCLPPYFCRNKFMSIDSISRPTSLVPSLQTLWRLKSSWNKWRQLPRSSPWLQPWNLDLQTTQPSSPSQQTSRLRRPKGISYMHLWHLCCEWPESVVHYPWWGQRGWIPGSQYPWSWAESNGMTHCLSLSEHYKWVMNFCQ